MLKEYLSPVWGVVSYWIYKDKYVTVYTRVDERRYKFFRRNGPQIFSNDDVSDTEEDWSGYLIGGRSARFDFDLKIDVQTDEEIHNWIDSQIQDAYDKDEIPSFHVERVTDDENKERWEKMDADALWAEYDYYYQTYKQALILERESDRKKAQIFTVGHKFGWEY